MSSLVGGEQVEVFPVFDLPADMQRVILAYVPLPDLARLACLSKELRTAYVKRVTKRDATVAAILQSHFTAAFCEGLSPSQTALPWDLIVSPPVREASSSDYTVSSVYYCLLAECCLWRQNIFTSLHLTSTHNPYRNQCMLPEGRRL